jgi:hypothetical protein
MPDIMPTLFRLPPPSPGASSCLCFTAEIRAAMEKTAEEFRAHGGEIYLPKDAAE